MRVILDIAFYSEPGVNTLEQILHKHKGSWEHYSSLPQDQTVYLIKFANFRAQHRIGNLIIEVLPLPSFLQLKNFLKNLIAEKRPNLVITHSLLYPLKHAVLQAQLKEGTKVAVQLHADGIRRNPFMRLLQRLAYNQIDYVLITGKDQLLPFFEHKILSKKVAVIEMMEGSSSFEKKRNYQLAPKIKLLWVGRFISGKDINTFIAACDSLKKNGFLFTAEIISSGGPLLGETRKKIETLNLQNELNISLQVAHHQMQTKYSSADLFISTSLNEGSGWALCEAMACGVASIVTNIPSHRWMTDNGRCGALIDCGNAQQLADAIFNCATKTEVLGNQARRVFEQRLSFSTIANTIHRLL